MKKLLIILTIIEFCLICYVVYTTRIIQIRYKALDAQVNSILINLNPEFYGRKQ